ncbi:hypothetical protein [Parabacteroides faecis]|uniref:hypothetical protein n=1 Tax=Parabacteroides faecis TaxID=1217282 RepID=UPI00351FE7BC
MITQLLKIPPALSEETVKCKFTQLADLLFNEYEIIKGEKTYDFLEIEFYFYSNNHPDITTYKRNMQAGRWHTHLSGIDISFESNTEYFGGILIRSIIDNNKKVINGPLCTLFELFDNIDIKGSNENIPQLQKKDNHNNIQIETTTRFNINSGKYKDWEYRFYNASQDIKWKSSYSANPTHSKHPQ